VNIWLTTTELEQHYGITRGLSLKYAPSFEYRRLSRRTGASDGGPGSNPWLFSPRVIPFLQDRALGRPRREPSKAEVERMVATYSGSTNAVAKELGISWRLAHRWLCQVGLKENKVAEKEGTTRDCRRHGG
jgi:hypothetical protein